MFHYILHEFLHFFTSSFYRNITFFLKNLNILR